MVVEPGWGFVEVAEVILPVAVRNTDKNVCATLVRWLHGKKRRFIRLRRTPYK